MSKQQISRQNGLTTEQSSHKYDDQNSIKINTIWNHLNRAQAASRPLKRYIERPVFQILTQVIL